MRYYLDTNILEFMRNSRNTDLHNDIYSILSDYSHTLMTSNVCVAELIHLAQIGKIGNKRNDIVNGRDILEWVTSMGIEIIPVNPTHLREYAELPIRNDHRDPNDRLIVAQAIADRVPLISSDRKFNEYIQDGLDFIYNER